MKLTTSSEQQGINLYTEKNKLAPSQYSVPVVFDKKYGIHPKLSEYWFLLNKTKTENKLYPKDKKMPYPLLITGTPTKRVLDVINPEDGSSMYNCTFNESKFLEKYQTDETFRSWFDYAVDVSVQQRIILGMFRTEIPSDVQNSTTSESSTENQMIEVVNPETGEVTYQEANT